MEEQIMKEYSKWKSGKRFLTAAITLSLLGSLGLYSPAHMPKKILRSTLAA